jgi:type IV protein arginine methyltransferase
VLHEIPEQSVDGLFFDTYSEHYEDMQDLHDQLPRLLRPGGIYSYFNGCCPRNPFFASVHREVVRLEMKELGLDAQFVGVQIDASDDKIWTGVKTRYFGWSDTYYIPVCQRGEDGEKAEA